MTEVGTCEVVMRNGRMQVVRADPHIRISRDLLTFVRAGVDPPRYTVTGDLFTIHADPPVTYRVYDDGVLSDVPASLVQEAPA